MFNNYLLRFIFIHNFFLISLFKKILNKKNYILYILNYLIIIIYIIFTFIYLFHFIIIII